MRPDQPRFDRFARELSALDDVLEAYCSIYQLGLRKNPFRQQGFDLHTWGNPKLMFGINLDGHWLQLDWDSTLTYMVGVCAGFDVASGSRLIKRLTLAGQCTIGYICENIESLLEEGWRLLEDWEREAVQNGNEAHLRACGWEGLKTFE